MIIYFATQYHEAPIMLGLLMTCHCIGNRRILSMFITQPPCLKTKLNTSATRNTQPPSGKSLGSAVQRQPVLRCPRPLAGPLRDGALCQTRHSAQRDGRTLWHLRAYLRARQSRFPGSRPPRPDSRAPRTTGTSQDHSRDAALRAGIPGRAWARRRPQARKSDCRALRHNNPFCGTAQGP